MWAKLRADSPQEAITLLRDILDNVIETQYETFRFVKGHFLNAIAKFGAEANWYSPNALRNTVYGKLAWTNGSSWREMPFVYDVAATKVTVKGRKEPLKMKQVFYRDTKGQFASNAQTGAKPVFTTYYRAASGRFAKGGAKA